MTGTDIIWAVVKIAVMVGFLVNVAGLLTWLDRRQGAMIQDRIGPNRAHIPLFGKKLRILGLLHTAADGVKFFFKEDFVPPKADKLLFALAPILSLMPVITLAAVIPMGDTVCPRAIEAAWDTVVSRHGVCPVSELAITNPETGAIIHRVIRPVDLSIASLNVGVLFVFAAAGYGIVGAAIAGWSSDNKFSLMGALRAASQMVSYEVAMGLSIVGAFMIYGTVRLDDMVRWQGENAWGIFVQPVAFILFFVAVVAESKRIPFDLPEAESELVSGYFTEYSGMKFGMFFFAEYMEVVTSSMLLVTIFLGGWELPFFHRDGITIAIGSWEGAHVAVPHLVMTILGVLTFFGKTLAICWLQCFVRWSLPRFRYDQLMKLGWRVLLPAALANVMATGIVYLAIDQASVRFQEGLRTVGEVTQLVVAVAITVLVVRGIIGFIRRREPSEWIVGTAAKLAAARGGTKWAPFKA